MTTGRVRKAVIPAAGLGTRVLPATKSAPKELLPVVDKPAIQYVVEEAVRAGITEIVVITGRNKSALEDHFDRSPELEAALERSGKHEALAEVRRVAELAHVCFVRQREALGLGHAVGTARAIVGDEPFAVLLPDDIMVDDSALLRAMLIEHAATGGSVLGLEEVPAAQTASYGCVDPATTDRPGVVEVRGVVEKPAPEVAPSNLAIIGRYVLTPEVFDHIERLQPGAGGELQLTDAISALLDHQVVSGCVSPGLRYDVGRKLDFLRANVALALDRTDLGPELLAWLRTVVADRPDA
ncbi:MAG: UTP--glucose-1-phosphate uridylyltransferase GalU [Actinomycetota bacterium]